MSEVVEEIAVRRLPLEGVHRGLGASLTERDGWSVPAHYGDVAAEYKVVREGGAGLIDLSSRGLVEVSGAEAVQFLNGLITNDVKTLNEGAWMPAAFPNVQGRLVAAARVIRHGGAFLFDTEAATSERVFKTLERFTLAGDFRVADRRDGRALLSLQGAGARDVVGAVLGAEASELERGRVQASRAGDVEVMSIRATHTAEDGFDLFVDAARASELWAALTAAGAQPVGFDALEVLRVEAGLPRYGVDMSDANVVLETGMDDAVSYTKGCYVGQEIIARIHWRGHVAKRLAGLSFDEGVEALPPESKILDADGREIGRITSSVYSPHLTRAVALGYVKYAYLAEGTTLRVVSDGDTERAAKVVALPFVRGGWHAAEATEATQTGAEGSEQV
ncbi:MAG TPA: aminomethyltransferase family protein [Pyrinomonadaceae bacterium]|jgi:folate-binding protein YgfZ